MYLFTLHRSQALSRLSKQLVVFGSKSMRIPIQIQWFLFRWIRLLLDCVCARFLLFIQYIDLSHISCMVTNIIITNCSHFLLLFANPLKLKHMIFIFAASCIYESAQVFAVWCMRWLLRTRDIYNRKCVKSFDTIRISFLLVASSAKIWFSKFFVVHWSFCWARNKVNSSIETS